MLALTVVVVVLGTVVTSTGPHAGAPDVPRFGFSLHAVAQLHGTSVELLLALTVGTLWSMHRARVAPAVLRRGEWLLVVLVAQAAVGYSQYLSGDPVLLVGIHIAGATAVVIAMVVFNLGLYTREPVTEVQTVSASAFGRTGTGRYKRRCQMTTRPARGKGARGLRSHRPGQAVEGHRMERPHQPHELRDLRFAETLRV